MYLSFGEMFLLAITGWIVGFIIGVVITWLGWRAYKISKDQEVHQHVLRMMQDADHLRKELEASRRKVYELENIQRGISVDTDDEDEEPEYRV